MQLKQPKLNRRHLFSTINKLVEENLSLQKEVERVQDEYKDSLKEKFTIVSNYPNPENAPEEQKAPQNPEICGEVIQLPSFSASPNFELNKNSKTSGNLPDDKSPQSRNKSFKSIVIRSSSGSSSSSGSRSGSVTSSDEEQYVVVTRKVQTQHTGSFHNEISDLNQKISSINSTLEKYEKKCEFLQEKIEEKESELAEKDIQNKALIQALKDKERVEVNQLLEKNTKKCQAEFPEEPKVDSRFDECRIIIDRYQAIYEDLQAAYSLPEELEQECKVLFEKYQDLLICVEESIPRESTLEDYQDAKVDTVESYDEPIPLKDSSLNVSHIKHKCKIPVLDLSKVPPPSSSDDEEEVDPEPPAKAEPPNSVSSDSDGDNIVQIVKYDEPDDFILTTEEAKDLVDGCEDVLPEVLKEEINQEINHEANQEEFLSAHSYEMPSAELGEEQMHSDHNVSEQNDAI